jgi:hypothetical protein
MTVLGPIEGVERTLYRDEVEQTNIYPLDQKLGLLQIGGRYSRYTSKFAHLAGDYYARLPERDVLVLLNKTLNIDLEQGSLTAIGGAVAQPYLPHSYDETEDGGAPQTEDARQPGFVEERIQKINVDPEREAILKSALQRGADGVERKRLGVDQVAAYILSDGIGVSGLPGELSDKGKNGGPAKTFEAKIGAVFTQSFDSNGLPLLAKGSIYREPGSTRYTGTVEKIGQFTKQIEEFARKNKVEHAGQVVFLSDGALWLENLRNKLFPDSIGIVDFYHASQHLYKIADTLRFHSRKKKNAFVEKCYRFLELGEIEPMADLIMWKAIDSNRESVGKQLSYFTGNKDRMRYGLFRAAGLFIGSGVIEAGCKTIVENRLNRSGMRWTKKNAANVIALRCAIYSGAYDADAA